MHYLEGNAEAMAQNSCRIAANLARNSKCQLARHGVVIVQNGCVLGKGWNTPVTGYGDDGTVLPCDPCLRIGVESGKRYELCRAIHAEQNAIFDALVRKGRQLAELERLTGELDGVLHCCMHSGILAGSVLYHARITPEGEIKRNNAPECDPCSRLIKHVGIDGVVLVHEQGYAYYPADEFNDLSYAFHNIDPVRR